MTNITIVKIKQNVTTIEATGHSGYAEEGGDIVCAAVSTLLEHLINGLTEIVKVKVDYVIDEEIPHLSVTLPKDLSKETNSLFPLGSSPATGSSNTKISGRETITPAIATLRFCPPERSKGDLSFTL